MQASSGNYGKNRTNHIFFSEGACNSPPQEMQASSGFPLAKRTAPRLAVCSQPHDNRPVSSQCQSARRGPARSRQEYLRVRRVLLIRLSLF